jgi:hypothetical protein
VAGGTGVAIPAAAVHIPGRTNRTRRKARTAGTGEVVLISGKYSAGYISLVYRTPEAPRGENRESTVPLGSLPDADLMFS